MTYFVAVTALALGAAACPVCTPYPVTTRVDRLLGADVVVLARESDATPFSYAVVEVLAGTTDASTVDLFVNSIERRRLAAYPDLHAVLVREYGDWSNLGTAEPALVEIMRAVLRDAPAWSETGGDSARARFFAELMDDAEEDHFFLAYPELARAPYAVIRTLARDLPKDRFRAMFRDAAYVEWRPLALLVLGCSDAPADHALVESSFAFASAHGLTERLGARATALVELRGGAAVDRIEREYLTAERSDEELREVILALSIHGREGRVELRDRIVEGYRSLLDAHPHLAGAIAPDLVAWERWDFRNAMAGSLDLIDEDDADAARPILEYLRAARGRSTPASD